MDCSKQRLFEHILTNRSLLDRSQLKQIKHAAIANDEGLFARLINLKTVPVQEMYQTASEVWSVAFIDLSTGKYRLEGDCGIPQTVLVGLSAVCVVDEKNERIIAVGLPEKLGELHRIHFYSDTPFSHALADINQIKKIQNQQQALNRSPRGVAQTELNNYLEQADSLTASDIHIESFYGYCRLRVRVDGILHPLESISCEAGRKLISQIKLLGDMDIAQSRLPQDGRIHYKLEQKRIALRVNSMPTIHGEKLVLRLLEHHGRRYKLDKIGLFASQYRVIRGILKQPSGLILVTGPTGSGKTVTLYAILDLLNTGKENICTIEDPVEIQEDGINQVSINRKAGLDFGVALRALLRQDPDILMVGEIRDVETAEIAVKAAQTGHLVMATLHCHSAAAATTRLLQLGIKDYALNDALKLVIAQRLPRQLCKNCRSQLPTPQSLCTWLRNAGVPVIKTVYREKGCNLCMQGFSGRSGIFELLDPSWNTGGEIKINPDQVQARFSLEQAGLTQVGRGRTTFEELIRVL